VFGHVFKGLELMQERAGRRNPTEWLKKLADKYLTEEEKKQIEAMGGLASSWRPQAAHGRAEESATGRQQVIGTKALRRSANSGYIRRHSASAATAQETPAR